VFEIIKSTGDNTSAFFEG